MKLVRGRERKARLSERDDICVRVYVAWSIARREIALVVNGIEWSLDRFVYACSLWLQQRECGLFISQLRRCRNHAAAISMRRLLELASRDAAFALRTCV